jgi:hypothetical protein
MLCGQLSALLGAPSAQLCADPAVLVVRVFLTLGSAGDADLCADKTDLAVEAGLTGQKSDARGTHLCAIKTETGAFNHRHVHLANICISVPRTRPAALAQGLERARETGLGQAAGHPVTSIGLHF